MTNIIYKLREECASSGSIGVVFVSSKNLYYGIEIITGTLTLFILYSVVSSHVGAYLMCVSYTDKCKHAKKTPVQTVFSIHTGMILITMFVIVTVAYHWIWAYHRVKFSEQIFPYVCVQIACQIGQQLGNGIANDTVLMEQDEQ